MTVDKANTIFSFQRDEMLIEYSKHNIQFQVSGLKRCFKCRSRGDLGSCKDAFIHTNATGIEHVAGVEAIPCASGWCGKVLEGGANSFKDEGKLV